MPQTTYLMSIHNASGAIDGQGEPDKAREVFELMRDDPNQRRKHIEWNDTLARVAYAYCVDQAQRGFTGHVNPDGFGANKRVRDSGYCLPSWYPDDDANNVESLLHNGNGSVEGAWRAWMNSPGHRAHLLGENSSFAEQTQVGIAYFEGGEKRHYWCVLSCPEEE